jgi:hypothetical protein
MTYYLLIIKISSKSRFLQAVWALIRKVDPFAGMSEFVNPHQATQAVLVLIDQYLLGGHMSECLPMLVPIAHALILHIDTRD